MVNRVPLLVFSLLFLIPSLSRSQDLIITGVIDGPLDGGLPKAIELYAVNNIADLSIYGIGSANNGGGSDGEELTLSGSASAGQYIYVASESTGFNTFFGFVPDFTSSAASINGDDAIELFMSGSVVDIFGDINVDGTGQAWEYLDGWAYRNNGTGPDGSTFVLGNWSFSGPNALDGQTTNGTATTPFPIGTYSIEGCLGDETDPTALCQVSVPVVLGPGGSVTLSPTLVDNGSMDDCDASPGLGLDISTFDCEDLDGAAIAVVLTVTDSEGNSSTCGSSVSVSDPDGFCVSTESGLVITGVVDGPLSGGIPKAVELYALDNIIDLSAYGIGSANNGGGSDGQEFTFPEVCVSKGTYLYVASEETGFESFFGFSPDYTSSALGINGDDAIELFLNGSVVDVFGEINVDGSGEPWEYLDGWAYRKDATGPDGSAFDLTNWSFSGINTLDGESANEAAATPFPLGSYMLIADGPCVDLESPELVCTNAVLDVDLSGDLTVIPGDVLICAFDDCDIELSIGISRTDFTCEDVGSPVMVTLTATDDAGNTGSCMAEILITDQLDACNATIEKIHSVQGNGPSVTRPGKATFVKAVVTGDYQGDNELSGFFVQEETGDEDGDPSTSEGIFVFCDDCPVDVKTGDVVRVLGIQTEFFGLSQIDVSDGGTVEVIGKYNVRRLRPERVDLPAPGRTDEEATFESIEGMLVRFTDPLFATEYFQLGRFGSVVLSEGGRQRQFTEDNTPDPTAFAEYEDLIESTRVILDDRSSNQNVDPVLYPKGGFSNDNFIRGGYRVWRLQGIMDWGFGAYRVRPVDFAFPKFRQTFDSRRTRKPRFVGSDIKVASFNVLNYFNGDGMGGGFPTPRGADSPEEFARQTAKIAAALKKIDADVVALIELENDYEDGDKSAVAALVDSLKVRGLDYSYVMPRSDVGSDVIAVGFIYKTAAIQLAEGTTVEILDDSVLPGLGLGDLLPVFDGDETNRAALAATFEVIDRRSRSSGEQFTAVVNHFKSKGGSGSGANEDQSDGQGAFNARRTDAAIALSTWLSTAPTGTADEDYLILGDLNAYGKEDPIVTLENAGYTDLNDAFEIRNNYSFVFDGKFGSLDYAMANEDLLTQVTGITEWHINADEVNLLDYNFEFKPSAPVFVPDQYRSSDHDPVIIGLRLRSSKPSDDLVIASASSTKENIEVGHVTAFPNPVNRLLYLQMRSEVHSGSGTIELFNQLGQTVHQRSVDVSSNNTWQIDVGNLAPGTYLVRITTELETADARVVVAGRQ